MNILQLDTAKSWRGGQNQVYLMSRGLQDLGIKSYFAVPEAAYSIPKFGEVGDVLTYNSWGLPHFLSAAKIAAFARAKNIAIMDAHSSHAHALGLAIKKLLPDLKLVVHRRVDNKPRMNFFSRKKYLSRDVSQFVAISYAIKKVLLEAGVAEERIKVVHSAVVPRTFNNQERDTLRALLRQRLKLSEDTLVLSCAAAFTAQKGQWILLEALNVLSRRSDVPPWHCVFAGDGEMLGEMKRLCYKFELNNHVSFLGFIDKVPELLAASDIFALPSMNEGLGTIILDAIYAGATVVASEVGGIPEMIIHDKTGLLSPVGDAASLANAIGLLLSDAELRNRLLVQAREHAHSEFSLNAMVRGNLAVYRSLVQ